jgi:predicted transcriptional regulator
MVVSTSMGAPRPEEWIYGEKKTAKQFMLTETASNAIDKIAEKLKISRSEVIERAIRGGGLSAAENFDADSINIMKKV